MNSQESRVSLWRSHKSYTCNHETSSPKSQNSWEVYKINVGGRITLGKMRNGMEKWKGVGEGVLGREQGEGGGGEKKRGELECGVSEMISHILFLVLCL